MSLCLGIFLSLLPFLTVGLLSAQQTVCMLTWFVWSLVPISILVAGLLKAGLVVCWFGLDVQLILLRPTGFRENQVIQTYLCIAGSLMSSPEPCVSFRCCSKASIAMFADFKLVAITKDPSLKHVSHRGYVLKFI
jgi:hypothetical protein